MRPKEIGPERSPRAKLGRLAAHYGLNSDIELRPESAKGLPQPKKHEQSPLTYSKYPPAEPGALGIGPLEAAILDPKLYLFSRRTKYSLPTSPRPFIQIFLHRFGEQDGAGMMRGSDRL